MSPSRTRSSAEATAAEPSGRVSAAEAARRLGISRDTLYAYVSRGLIRSEAQVGTRERLYRLEDVELLRERRLSRRDPARTAREALHWGTPILESELTLISDGAIYYRGWPLEGLARSSTIEDVAALLWGGASWIPIPRSRESAEPPEDAWEQLGPLLADAPTIEQLQLALAAAAARDPGGLDLAPESVRRTGSRILRLVTAVAAREAPAERSISETLARSWGARRAALRSLIEAALVLHADHELNVGTFAVRCVASARASPYQAVMAGLAALSGDPHGQNTERLAALWQEVRRPEDARSVLEARLRRGDPLPGFGQTLYPEGDPRARLLLEMIAEASPKAGEWAVAQALEAAATDLVQRAPNSDFALVALQRCFGLPAHAPLALFAVARSVGWIAHALEHYQRGRLIRPRASYTGRPPQPADGA